MKNRKESQNQRKNNKNNCKDQTSKHNKNECH